MESYELWFPIIRAGRLVRLDILPHQSASCKPIAAPVAGHQDKDLFHLEVAAGDQFLVLTGLYPEFLDHRAERQGAPGLGFYESFARQAYHSAAGQPGITPATRNLFGLLSETFPLARRSLNRMSDRCLF